MRSGTELTGYISKRITIHTDHKYLFLCLLTIAALSCKKTPPVHYAPRHVMYLVRGSHIRLNFIDSTSVFQRDRIYTDSFRYEFKRGPGTGIGMSVGVPSPADTISGWELRIDGKLYANAFSTGGAYLTIPYN